jgi:GT2 family glycosyltransferase|tara:strand:+ start:62 stop:946 length:885 start_codon:yes stop_codon:yes gene_type:complete
MTISLQNLSVVIVSFHSEDVIHNCIKSIIDKIEIIVVENSGNKEFANKIENQYKNVKCILSPQNLGMGAGNNLGLKHIKTDYVFILNPDIILKKDTIEEIIIASKKIENFGLIAPLSDNLKYPNYILNKKKELPDFIDPFKVESVDGFAMILNLRKLKKIDQFKDNNFFDENIFLYLENDDLCKRINKFENIFIVPKSKINHLGASGVNKKYSEQIELSRNWHWIWSKFYFNKKHYGFLKAMFECFPSFLSAILKVLFYFLINNNKKGIYLHRVLGFLNALLGKKSYHRPKIDN